MKLRKHDSLDSFALLRYRQWLWDNGASVDEGVNLDAWYTSSAYQEMLKEWEESKKIA